MPSWIKTPSFVCSDVVNEIEQFAYRDVKPTIADWNECMAMTYDAALERACTHGFMPIAEWALEHGANNYKPALVTACFNGHIHVVMLVAETAHMNQHSFEDFGLMLSSACEGGNFDVAKWIYKYGLSIDYFSKRREYNVFGCAMQGAARGGCMDIMKWATENLRKHERPWPPHVLDSFEIDRCFMAMMNACENGHTDVTIWLGSQLLLRPLPGYGVEGETPFDRVLWIACEYGHIDIVKWTVRHGATRVDRGLWATCKGGFFDIAKWLAEQGAVNFKVALKIACRRGYLDIVKFAAKRIHLDTYCDDDRIYNCHSDDDLKLWLSAVHAHKATQVDIALWYACEWDHHEVVKWLVEWRPKLGNLALKAACALGRMDIAEWLKKQ